ncbi:MAG: hypothetical protein U0821_27340 [Chloroflexota bacterium]
MFPADNVWNARVDTLPVHLRSSAWVNSIGANSHVHADFGSGTWNGGPIGIPYVIVSGSQAPVTVTFRWADESDAGPYRVPPSAPIEWGGDHHVLVVDQDNCTLAELYAATKLSDTAWHADSGAIFDLRSNALRPATWTSADAAGLPILPGLARYDEVSAGEIQHALRFTAPATQSSFIWPARHEASDDANPNLPPMGARFRLKSHVNPSAYPAQARVILTALQRYGMILADNGSSWYISGAPDEGWNNDWLHAMDPLKGSDFEAVDASVLMVNANTGQAQAPTIVARPPSRGGPGGGTPTGGMPGARVSVGAGGVPQARPPGR